MSLRQIYEAMSEMAVGDIGCRNLDEIKLTVRAEDCPMRLLLPSTKGDQGFIAIGSLSKTLWHVRDLCLWQPVVAGSGIEQCANELLTYVEEYGAAVRALKAPTAESVIVTVVFQLGPVPWAATDFWAVDTLVGIEEFLT